jgi:N-acyl homoserine lactone hydrolase
MARSVYVWYYALLFSGCASTVAPIVATRVAPDLGRAATVQACWVEFADSLGFTASGVILRHGTSTLLVDAGQSRHFTQEVAAIPWSQRLYLKLVPGALTPQKSTAEVLRAAGVEPSQLKAVVPTHVHSDHVGGLMDLPDVPVWLAPLEIEHLRDVSSTGPFNVLPAHARRLLKTAEPLAFRPGAYEVFRERDDLFGDGSVVVVPMAGHTPGSVGVFVNTPRIRLLLVGDALNTLAQLTPPQGKDLLLRRTDLDPRRADELVGRLASLHQQLPSLRILPAHERATWLRVFGAPGKCL